MGILDLIFPKNCLSCKEPGSYMCDNCLKKVRKAKPICFYCKKASIDGMTHEKCKKKLGLLRFVSPWIYEGVVRNAIIKLKYNFSYDISEKLVLSFIGKTQEVDLPLPQNVRLTSIPLHKKRKNWRGFNQSALLAKQISLKLSYQFIPDLLERTKNTLPQAQLRGEKRKVNIKGVFGFNKKYKLIDKSKETFIFDDVSTTGSTLKEAVKVLKRNGFEKVSIMTVART